MLTYIIITVAIIAAICFIPLLRTILRWILFLPISLLAGILIPYIDIPNLIIWWHVMVLAAAAILGAWAAKNIDVDRD